MAVVQSTGSENAGCQGWGAPALLFVVALVVRLACLVWVTGLEAPLTYDMQHYHQAAVHLARGQGYHVAGTLAFRPPMLSVVLGGVYRLTGPGVGVARCCMAVASALIAPVLWALARALGLGSWRGWVGGAAGWALYPLAVRWGTQILSENLAALLVVLSTLQFIRCHQEPRLVSGLICGILWGALALTRPRFLLLPVVLLCTQCCLVGRGGWPRWLWGLGLCGFAMVLAPWVVRNGVRLGAFIPGTTSAGVVFAVANEDLAAPQIQAGGYRNPSCSRPRIVEGPEATWNREGWVRGWAGIAAAPHRLPGVMLARALRFWHLRVSPGGPWTWRDWIQAASWAPLFGLAVWAVWRCGAVRLWVVLAPVVTAFVPVLFLYGAPRLRFPVDPLVICLAVIGAEGVARGWRAWDRPRA